jgi:acyl-CoA hydrolase
MDWREEYKRRLASAQEAVEVVRGSDLVVIPIAGPRLLPNALARLSREVP